MVKKKPIKTLKKGENIDNKKHKNTIFAIIACWLFSAFSGLSFAFGAYICSLIFELYAENQIGGWLATIFLTVWLIIVLWKGLIDGLKFALISFFVILGIGGILAIIGSITYAIALVFSMSGMLMVIVSITITLMGLLGVTTSQLYTRKSMIKTAQLSVKEYEKIVATGVFCDRRIELIEGNLIEVSPETPYHANCNNKLYKYFLTLFNSLADVRSAHPISLINSEPQPDLVLAKLPDTLYDKRHPEPEDIYLLIEISYSTLSYDLNEKKRVYAKSKIQEYWIIDLENHRLIIFKYPQGDDYQNKIEFNNGFVSCLAFPDVTIEVNKLIN